MFPTASIRYTLSLVMPVTDASQLCLECGLCCNGVIFADVRLQPGDDPARLTSLGLPLTAAPASRPARTRIQKFPQPCAALEGCRCSIYPDRPEYCRAFECLLLKRVQSGRLEIPAARRSIRAALRRAEEVKRLLRELGDREEQLALSPRFQRVKRRLESESPDEEAAEVFGRLTLAVHDLNVLLGETFYPAPTGTRGTRPASP
jgi:Fe-S-cluster containining protein